MGTERGKRKPTTNRTRRGSTTQRAKSPSFKRGARKGPSIANKISGFLLGANKAVRDINALNKGTIVDRVVRRATGKVASKGLGSDIFKLGK